MAPSPPKACQRTASNGIIAAFAPNEEVFMRKLRSELPPGYIHVTQRGLGRRLIFEDDHDKRRYLAMLRDKLEHSGVSVLVWTLMPNHVHLLVRAQPAELSKLMQRLGTSYAQYFNGRHGHVGKVFQNRFSSEPVETEAHMLVAIRYIHRNAEVARIATMRDYPWSSYREILGKRVALEGEGICDASKALEFFGSMEEFSRFHAMENEVDGFARVDGYRPRLSDSDAYAIVSRHYGKGFADSLPRMPKEERDEALRTLKILGLSIRQIERLTGIGRGPITKA